MLDIDQAGHYRLMRRDPIGRIKYFTGQINDTLRNQITITFLNNAYARNYLVKPGEPVFYDGFTYCIDYEIKSKPKALIQFIPDSSPKKIQEIALSLDSLVYSTTATEIAPFDFNKYKTELQRIAGTTGLKIPKRMLNPKVKINKLK